MVIVLAAPVLLVLRPFAPPLIARGTLAAAAGAVVVVGGVWFVGRAFAA